MAKLRLDGHLKATWTPQVSHGRQLSQGKNLDWAPEPIRTGMRIPASLSQWKDLI